MNNLRPPKRDELKVVHVIDQYLNQTMNWVHRLIHATPVQHHVSAFSYVKNDFDTKNLKFHRTAWQRLIGDAASEWQLSFPHKLYSRMGQSFHNPSLRNYIEREEIDVAHFHFATTASKCLKLIRAKNFKSVVSFYGYDYHHAWLNNPKLRSDYKQLFKSVDLFLVEGNEGKRNLIRLGAPEEKIAVLHLGIDTDEIRFKPHTKTQNTLRLIQAATFTPKKGQLATISAVEKALENTDALTLDLYGEIKDQAYYDACVNMIRDHKLEKQIQIHPFVSFAEWHSTLAKYDVLIQPSRKADDGDCEGGAPVTLIDAQAVGRPVISTRHCDIPEVVLEGQSGLLTEEDDVGALSDAILSFYHMDRDEYSKMAKTGRDHMEAEYNMKASGKELAKHYESLVS